MITVMVVDDHAVVRAGLVRVLGTAPDVRIVAQAADGDEALGLLAHVDPDVILMDLSMPGMDGVTATRRILAMRPNACVVALTSFGDRERVITMVDAGARGYLVKDGDPEELITAIRSAAGGGSPLAPVAASVLLRSRQARSSLQDLTTREREVLELLAAGLSNRAIGERLGVTEATVKAHLTRVYTRLGVTDRVSAAMRAREMGLGPEASGSRS
jgi:DNA-binding NarL/FixJ family response regulator